MKLSSAKQPPSSGLYASGPLKHSWQGCAVLGPALASGDGQTFCHLVFLFSTVYSNLYSRSCPYFPHSSLSSWLAHHGELPGNGRPRPWLCAGCVPHDTLVSNPTGACLRANHTLSILIVAETVIAPTACPSWNPTYKTVDPKLSHQHPAGPAVIRRPQCRLPRIHDPCHAILHSSVPCNLRCSHPP